MTSVFKSLPDGWQNKTIVGLSILLAASPWLLGYADVATAKWDAVVVAAIIGIGAGAVLLWSPYWPDFIAAFVAFWLAGSSRILDFTNLLAPTILDVVIGCAVIVLALWSAIARARSLYAARAGSAGSGPPAMPPSAA